MIDKMDSGCMQGGSRPLNNYMIEPRLPHPAWQFAPRLVKSEPMEEDKNDSGVASGSDFHSSSPGSDSQDHPLRYYSMLPQVQAMLGVNMYHPNPLTPPNSEPLVSPKSEKDTEATLTPCASPGKPEEDHLKRLEISLEKNLSVSSKNSEHSDNDLEDYDESIKVPRVNSHGKVKTFKCKQCGLVSQTKIHYWNHYRTHIRADKILTCPKCPFVTEYKHHLEYHLRNHAGSKPFQCDVCDYSCVNKSMLNSHMKSHSNIYRFRCRDCTYASKYCHSLKIHLRRYRHEPSVVLDEDGRPDPNVIIDVYGTRRGPKLKTAGSKNRAESPPRLEGPLLGMNLLPQIPQTLPFNPFFSAELLQKLIMERRALASMSPVSEPQIEPESPSVLDLSKPGPSGEQQKNRRKGPAFRVDPSAVEEESEDDEETATTMFSNVEVVQNEEKIEKKEESNEVADTNNNRGEEKKCQYCNMSFGDDVLYTMHMGYHGFHNPFTCNMCGVECSDKVSFFLHIARVAHS